MSWEQKVWGQVWHLFASDQSAVSFLQLVRGTRCSRHKHDERANLFAVISGKIEVEEWIGQYRTATELDAGKVYSVPSGIFHRFRVLESGQVVEVYWPDVKGGKVRLNDIHRLDEGGMDIERGDSQGGVRGAEIEPPGV